MSDPELDGVTKCPNCGEENDPEFDCELFGCANQTCEKIICENCASSGMYRTCMNCRQFMERDEVRLCAMPQSHPPAEPSERTKALREARELIKRHAVMTWNGGLTERSDGITDVLVDFDLIFPEVIE